LTAPLASSAPEYLEIPIALIDEPPLATRSSMDETKMDELVDSLRAIGQLQPIGVKVNGARFTVIYGHRRRLAGERAGLVALRCLVYPSDDVFAFARQFEENYTREEVSPTDEAMLFAELLEHHCGGDTDRVAALVRRSRAYVEGRLLLFQGDPDVFEALGAGKVTIGVAHELNKCDELAHRRMLLKDAIDGGATVAIVRGWVSEYFRVHKPAAANTSFTPSTYTPGPAPQTNYFTCAICRGTENVAAMQPINLHTYCREAAFDKMLALWERRHEFVRQPRTLDEARAAIDDLSERFPELLEPVDPRRV
jgi:ParB/RepB/Spo0J family partition protein